MAKMNSLELFPPKKGTIFEIDNPKTHLLYCCFPKNSGFSYTDLSKD